MERCKTCKHWKKHTWPDGEGDCAYITYGDLDGGKAEVRVSMVTGDALIHVVTASDFGCAQHEPRDAD